MDRWHVQTCAKLEILFAAKVREDPRFLVSVMLLRMLNRLQAVVEIGGELVCLVEPAIQRPKQHRKTLSEAVSGLHIGETDNHIAELEALIGKGIETDPYCAAARALCQVDLVMTDLANERERIFDVLGGRPS